MFRPSRIAAEDGEGTNSAAKLPNKPEEGSATLNPAKKPRLSASKSQLTNDHMMATDVEIDDSLYSRQRYVLGDSAMQRMARSKVLLVGLGGLGVEIAKNLILAGIKSLTVQDSKPTTAHDLGTQFFLREDDLAAGRNRAEASVSRLAELNPYVSVNHKTDPFDETSELGFLNDFQCVVLTEASLTLQLRVDAYCRTQSPPIKFISVDVYGLFCWAFSDFGDEFEVVDPNGEEPKEMFISKITKATPGVVTSLENKMHGFEDGDTVTFREISGMVSLNGQQKKIKVLSPYAFSICDTSDFGDYEYGGIATQVKVPVTVTFESLEQQLKTPSLLIPDLSKFDAPATLHLGLLAFHTFRAQHGRLPNIRCTKDAEVLISIAKDLNSQRENKVDPLDEDLLRFLSYTSRGCFAPLCAALGGCVAQEVLKALTGKFTPLNQWLCLDASELVSKLDDVDVSTFQPVGNRYDALKICIGAEMCKKLADLRVFMVGCGAIGCEMLKNYALLGVGSSDHGQITITDNDLIEKSNLNRQFLFRPHHIRKPKSMTAADSVKEINKDLNIDPQQHKVCPQTEAAVYTDDFFRAQKIVVNALDNVEARRYMDSRCVTNQRALLESGTMGTKGHVQVIVPHVTESYTSQSDPHDEEVPYCTLKSFPATIEHCIQWARDKFESSFVQKPSLYNKFWPAHQSPSAVAEELEKGMSLDGAIQVSKMALHRATTWNHCIVLARNKFEKYFNHKARHLVHAFPLDTRLKDGSLFWQSPKRPPTPQIFDCQNEIHIGFILAAAKQYARICGVKYSEQDTTADRVNEVIVDLEIPEFRPNSSKNIVTDESAEKPTAAETSSGDELVDAANRIKAAQLRPDAGTKVFAPMVPQEFEKDDDGNGHIDFINTAANLRGMMYCIESCDRLKTKRIAGHIVPAIGTTTAAVAGLVSVELVKVLQGAPIEHLKNCFLNLSLPVVVMSEPGAVSKTTMKCGVTYTIWDRWEVHGSKDFTLQAFINHFKEKHGVEVTMVVHGVKMVYVPIMPGHRKRLPQTLLKLIKPAAGRKYVDLVVSYAGLDEDEMGPPVRYFFN